MCGKLRQTLPFRSIHVNVLFPNPLASLFKSKTAGLLQKQTHSFILDNLLVELIDLDLLLAMRRSKQTDEIINKLLAVILDVFLRILANQQHLSDVALALNVTAIRYQ